MIKISRKFVFVLASAFLLSCGGEDKPDATALSQQAEEAIEKENKKLADNNPVDAEKINNLIHSIPSPIEVAHVIKDNGGEYRPEYLNPTSKAEHYTTLHEKSLNLGLYGADLAFATIYNKNQDALNYLSTVQSLSKDLNIDHFFDMKVIGRLVKNSENLDSLLLITTSNFEKINMYLHNQNRSRLTTLILSGGWVEGIYLLSQVYEQKPSEDLRAKIGEQKLVLEQLLELMHYYKDEESFRPLYESFEKLKDDFEKVSIETIQGEPTMQNVGGLMMVTSTSEQKITISEDVINDIKTQLKTIRKNITQ